MPGARKTTCALLCALSLAVAGLVAPPPAPALPTCDISWDRGAGTDSWHTAANWTGDVLPAPSDDVCLPANGGGAAVVVTSSVAVASVQGDEPLTLSSGTLTLGGTDASEVATFTQTGGTLDGSATLRVLGTFLWRDGTQTTPNDPSSTPSLPVAGSGRTVVATGATGAIRHSNASDPNASNSAKTLSRELEIEPGATLTHQDRNGTDSEGYVHLTGVSGHIDNDGTLRLLDNQDILGDTSRGIDNDGTLVKETGSATSNIDARYDNDGAFNVQAGTLQPSGSAIAAPHAGTFAITDGARLRMDGGGGHVVTGSITRVASGGADAIFEVAGATVTVQGPDGANLTRVTSGRLNFDTNPQALPKVEQFGGTLGGDAAVTVSDYLWRDGTQDSPNDPASTPSNQLPGTGRTIIPSGGTLAIRHSNASDPFAGNSAKTLARELEIQSGATATLQDRNGTDSEGYLHLTGVSGHIDNDGTLRLLDDQDILGDTSRGIDNDGTLVKETGTATSNIDPRFDNDGAIDVQAGTLQTSGGAIAVPHAGTFNIADGARLRMDGGGGHLMSGALAAITGGTGSIFEVAGASVAVEAPNSVPLTRVVSGRLDFNTNAQALPTVEQFGGTLGGDAPITVTSLLWRDGTQDTPNHPSSTPSNLLPGTGRTIIPSGGTVTIAHSNASDPNAGNSAKSLHRELQVSSGATGVLRDRNAADSQGYLSIAGTSGLLNIDGAFTIEDDQDIFSSGRGITLDSAGTLTKTDGTANTFLDPSLDLDGLVRVDEGTLRLRGGGHNTHAGTFDVDGASTLHWEGGTHVIDAASAGIRRTAATVGDAHGRFSAGSVTVNAPYDLQSTTIAGGASSFNHATTTGPLTLTGGRGDFNTAITPPSVTHLNGTLGGAGVVTTSSYLWRDGAQDTPNSGTASNPLPGTGRTVIPSGGSMTIAHSNASDPNAGNSPKSLNREVQISSGATGVLRDRNAADSQGYLSIFGTSGLLNIDGDFAIEDDQDIFSGGRGVTLDGAGTLTKVDGTATTLLDPSLDLDGLVTVDAGTLRIRGSGHNTHAGTFDIVGGSTLQWDGGTHVVDSAAGIRRKTGSAGDAHGRFSGGNVTVDAPYALQETTIAGGTATFNESTTTGPLTLTGGRGDFNTAITPPSVTHLNGTLGGAGVLTTASYLWRDGTQDTPNSGTPANPLPGTGRTVIPSGGSMTIAHSNASDPNAGNSPKSLNREIEISSGATGVLRDRNASDSQGYLSIFGTSGLLNIDGDFTIEDDQDIFSGGRGVSVDPAATLTKTDGTGQSIVQPPLDQEGTLVVDTGRMRLDNVADYNTTTDVLGGGAYLVRGTLALNQGDLDGLSGRLILDGAASRVDEAPTVAADDGLDEFDHVAAGGELELRNGRTLTTPASGGPLVADGTVTLPSGTTLVPTGGLVVNATGLLRGDGTVDGAVTNGGVVAPGTSPGRLTVDGDYTQGSGGTLRTEIEGATAATGYDQLVVTGAAALAGTLDIPDTVTRHEPAAGASFDVLTAGSRTGTFASVTNAVIDADRQFDPVYEPDRVRAVVTTAAFPALAIEDAASKTEGDSGTSLGRLDVTLSAPTRREVTVQYTTANGSAVQPGDYQTTTGTLTFAPGEEATTIDVPVVGDTLDEPDETLAVTLSSPDDATLAAGDAVGTLTIQDDDAAPAVSIRDEVLVEEPDTGSVTAALPVRLSAPSGRTVTVDVDSADDTATAGADYTALDGTVTFAPGETAKIADVAVLGDVLNEDTEHLDVALSAPSQATLDAGASSGRIGIVDNDPAGAPAPVTPGVSVDDVRVHEGDAGTTDARFLVTLSAATTHQVQVSYATGGGSASEPADYAARTGTLTFAPGQTERAVSVPVNGDTADESDETFDLTLSGPSGATIADATGRATIVDDDQPPPAPVERVVTVTVPGPPAPPPPPPPTPAASGESSSTTRVVGCVRGPRMRHRFVFPRKVKVGRRVVTRRSRIELVNVLLDKRRMARLTKAPYQVTVDITKLKPGKHSLVANARLRVPGSRRTSRKQLRFEFVVCG